MADNKDNRFDITKTDPRFKELSRKSRKTTVDKRFSKMFSDPSFLSTHKYDIYGRKNKPKEKIEKELFLKNYSIDVSEPKNKQKSPKKAKINSKTAETAQKINSKISEESGFVKKKQSEFELTKKIGFVEAESEEKLNLNLNKTNRLALTQQNWNNITAVDILALISAFIPIGDNINFVKIYKTKLGRKRLKREKKKGPKIPKKYRNLPQKEIVRKYEQDKQKYFFAEINCSSIDCASAIYESCNEVQLENSCMMINLSFIPNGKKLRKRNLREEARSVPENYKRPEFLQTSLGHTSLNFSWDNSDPKRMAVLNRNISGEIRLKDYEDYIGSTDSEEKNQKESECTVEETESEGERKIKSKKKKNKREKYIGLLNKIKSSYEENASAIDVQFDSAENKNQIEPEKNKNGGDNQNQNQNQSKKQNLKNPTKINTQKNDEANLKLILTDSEEDNKQNYENIGDLNKTKKLKKLNKMKGFDLKKDGGEEEIREFEINAEDKRFKSILNDRDFEIDPSNPLYKNTPSMKTFLRELRAKRKERNGVNEKDRNDENGGKIGKEDESETKLKNEELRNLVKSVKNKII